MAQIDSRLGDMIRSYREKLGLTQEEMAERLQVNLTHYGNIERAACNPSFSLFLRIAKELNLSVDAYLYSTRDDTAAEITRLLSKCSKRECQIISLPFLRIGMNARKLMLQSDSVFIPNFI